MKLTWKSNNKCIAKFKVIYRGIDSTNIFYIIVFFNPGMLGILEKIFFKKDNELTVNS